MAGSEQPSVVMPSGGLIDKRQYLIAVVADFGSDSLATLTPVDKDNFTQVLADARPTVALALKDALGAGSGEIEFRASFDALRAFEPAGFLKQFPAGQWRIGVREKVIARQTGQISPNDLANACSAAAAGDTSLAWLSAALSGDAGAASAPPSAGRSVLDDIADPTGGGSQVASDIEHIARSAGDPNARVSAAESTRLGSILARLDRELSSLANAVLKHPDVARLETSWRSLKFLIDRVDFREGVRVGIVSSPRDDAIDRLITGVIDPTFEGAIATPGMVVFDYTFTSGQGDMEALDSLAQHAQGVPVPVAFGIDPQFFAVKTLRLIKNLPNLSGLIDGWQFAKYRTLRDKPYSKALVPVLGRFVLRMPYAGKGAGGDLAVVETTQNIEEVRWGGGHWALAVCAGRAFAKHGWPTRMFGAESGKVEDLPVVTNPHDAASPWGPGDLSLPDRRVEELFPIGINALMSVPGKDYCMLLGGVTAARPIVTKEHGAQSAALEISLPYAQFSNMVSAYLCETLPTFRGLSPDDIQQKMLIGLNMLLGSQSDDPSDMVQVGVGEAPDGSGQTAVMVNLSPPPRIAPGGLHVSMSFLV